MRGRLAGIAAYAAVVALVVGGLGWVTRAALDLELSDSTRLALWRLDGRVTATLAREDGRPYGQYDALSPPVPLLRPPAQPLPIGYAFVPSPLLDADLPPWMLLHFQAVGGQPARSPQVLPPEVDALLRRPELHIGLRNLTAERCTLLAALNAAPAFRTWVASPEPPEPVQAVQQYDNNSLPEQQAANPSQFGGSRGNNDFEQRSRAQVVAKSGRDVTANNAVAPGLADALWQVQDIKGGGFAKIDPRQVEVGELKPRWLDLGDGPPGPTSVGGLKPRWLDLNDGSPRLVLARSVRAGDRQALQGVLLDWPKLAAELRAEVADLFPDAKLVPLRDGDPADRAMTPLPVRLDPGAAGVPGWTPLRVGLALAWLAAGLALLVVGLGGAALVDLGERRMRFVSAVTHELRTPLTTLRLYLDLLTSGAVRDEGQRAEYLQTLDAESDRLGRLIGNVLDFARLERQRPRVQRGAVDVGELMQRLEATWRERLRAAGLELVCESEQAPPTWRTDGDLLEQALAVLLDNAGKYARGAADGRVWLRCYSDSPVRSGANQEGESCPPPPRLCGGEGPGERGPTPRWDDGSPTASASSDSLGGAFPLSPSPSPPQSRGGGGPECRGRLIWEVEDRGPGVPLTERRGIFRPFRRGRDVPASAGGVGLGLALADRWVRLLGGRLECRAAAAGVGALFRVALPA